MIDENSKNWNYEFKIKFEIFCGFNQISWAMNWVYKHHKEIDVSFILIIIKNLSTFIKLSSKIINILPMTMTLMKLPSLSNHKK